MDPQRFTLVAPFEKQQSRWLESACINIDDPNDSHRYWLTTDFTSLDKAQIAVVDTFENMLYRHMYHPEPKSRSCSGQACQPHTRGLLQRAHIFAGRIAELERKQTATLTKAMIYRRCAIVRSNMNAQGRRVGVSL